MKLSGALALRFCARPDPLAPGVLIWGEDAGRVAVRRREVAAVIAGPDGEAEMRAERFPAADLRAGSAALADAVKARGFFPGPRVIVLDGVADGATAAIAAAIKAWQPGDAVIVATAGALPGRSSLRKLFEGHAAAASIALYDDPPSREEIDLRLRTAGLARIAPDAAAAVAALAQTLDAGDLRQTIEKIALYGGDAPETLTPDDVAACAPATGDADIDAAIAAIADGAATRVVPLVRRLEAAGATPVSLAIALLRHFRALHTIAVDPAGIAALRPPAFGPRRDMLARQARRWTLPRLETAIGVIIETDLAIRSSPRVPAMALVERASVRLAMLA